MLDNMCAYLALQNEEKLKKKGSYLIIIDRAVLANFNITLRIENALEK